MIKSSIKKHFKSLSHKDVNQLYTTERSLVNYFPVIDVEADKFILEDGISSGLFFEILPVPTETLSPEDITSIEDNVFNALTCSIPQLDDAFVLQTYVYDEPSLEGDYQALEDYIKARHSTLSPLQITFLQNMRQHYQNVSKPCGYFDDAEVSNTPWSGGRRRMVGCFYRRINSRSEALNPTLIDKSLDEAFGNFQQQLSEAQITLKLLTAKDFYWFQLIWLNPDINLETLKEIADIDPDELPFGQDLSTLTLLSQPRSDKKTGRWYFGGQPMKALAANGLRQVPQAFHITGERDMAHKQLALFDRMPPGTRINLTITFMPEDRIENHLKSLKQGAKGQTADVEINVEETDACLYHIKKSDQLFPAQLVVYIQADNDPLLDIHLSKTRSALLSAGIQLIDEISELAPLHSFIKNLPFNYEPKKEPDLSLSRYTFASHLTRLLPFYSRNRGTQNPGFSSFNRGGEVFTLDMLNLEDRIDNAFALVLGPPGSGKSATLNMMLYQAVAVHNARLFIIEKGRSFKLITEFFKAQGLTVEDISLHQKYDVSLPPFADATKLITLTHEEADLSDLRAEKKNPQYAKKLDQIVETPKEEDPDQRDILGEMELIARVMITGGERKEEDRMIRADRLMIRNALVSAAEKKAAENRQVLVEDVVAALKNISQDTLIPENRRNRALEMSDAMALFCSGLEGYFFNREGSSIPEADVVSMEIGQLAQEGYEHQLTIAFMSLMNTINGLVERDQYDQRPTIVLCDEAHLITTNPLLAPYVVKMIKMWRKLGAWLWLATQNLEDFPNESKKMLSLFEQWFLLGCGAKQMDEAKRFIKLTPEDEKMILRTRKEPGKYTEGAYLSKKVKSLLRLVPPPLVLAFSQTEKDEKAHRAQLMDELNLNELEAALKVAEEIEQKRGLGNESL